MGTYSYSGTAASNTTIDSIGSAGSDSPVNTDDIVRALAASQHNHHLDVWGSITAAGTADALTVAITDTALAAYFNGMAVGCQIASDNTLTTSTLNVNSIGAKTIKKSIDGVETAIAAGDLQAGARAIFVYRTAWASAAGAWEWVGLEAMTENRLNSLESCSFISTQDFSSDATGDFTLTNSSFDYYKLVLGNIVPATDATELRLRTSTNGGSSFDSGASDYAYAANSASSGGAASAHSDGVSYIPLISSVSNGATNGISGEIKIYFSVLTGGTIVEFKVGGTSSSSSFYFAHGMGQRSAAADVDAVRILFSSGNISTGTATLYGYRNT